MLGILLWWLLKPAIYFLLLLAAGLLYGINYALGWESTVALLRLVTQGCVRASRVSWQPQLSVAWPRLLAQGDLPPGLAGQPVFSATAISTDASLWAMLRGEVWDVVVTGAWVDCRLDASGQPALLRVLAHAGFVKEVAAPAAVKPTPLQATEHQEGPEAAPDSTGVPLPLRAELRVGRARVTLPDAHVLLSEDAARVIGPGLTLTAALGTTALRAMAAEHAAGRAAAGGSGNSLGDAQGTSTPQAGKVEPEDGAEEADDEEALFGLGDDLDWLSQPPPPGDEEVTGRPLYPAALALRSDSLALRGAGWRTSTGLRLRRPLAMQLAFTPELARYALRRVHPLLASALAVRQGGRLRAQVAPAGPVLHLPAEVITVRLQPMALVLGGSRLVSGAMKLLAQGRLSSSSTLHASTSALEADIYRQGHVVSKRLDVLVGPAASDAAAPRGVHLAMWGRVDTAADSALDMTLGIPGDTLAALGCRNLPEEFMMPVAVRGTAARPDINWIRAGQQLADLFLRYRIAEGVPLLGRWLLGGAGASRAPLGAAAPVELFQAPPPAGDLPWRALADMLRSGAGQGAASPAGRRPGGAAGARSVHSEGDSAGETDNREDSGSESGGETEAPAAGTTLRSGKPASARKAGMHGTAGSGEGPGSVSTADGRRAEDQLRLREAATPSTANEGSQRHGKAVGWPEAPTWDNSMLAAARRATRHT